MGIKPAHWLNLALAGLVTLMVVEPASARHRHRHRGPHASRQFVFPTPEAAQQVVGVGEFAGEFLPGIAGATTADPYRHPAYGYNQNGVYGPGYAYPGY